jgi:hypothetical protein
MTFFEQLTTVFQGFLHDETQKIVVQPSPNLPDWRAYPKGKTTIHTGFFPLYEANGTLITGIAGRIVEWPGLGSEVFIFNPPVKIRKLSKGPCLQLIHPNGSWFKVHWNQPPHNFEEAIAYMDGLINPTSDLNRNSHTNHG